MPPPEKKFVKYAFDQGNTKPKEQRRQSRDDFKQRDNNQQNRGRRHVSYTEKSNSRLNVLRDMINSFILFEKPTPRVEQMMKRYPKYFNPTSKEPEPFNIESLNSYLTLMGKKPFEREARTYAPIQPEEESDPNWDSDSDIEGGIQSKAIDPSIVEKAAEKLGTVRQLRQDELRRHQKQFLEDYYRQKHQEELQKQNPDSENGKDHKPKSQQSIDSNEPNEWTEYQEKQVENFVNMGFIQKIEEDENDDFGDSDFSVQDEKSQSGSSKKSSQDEDDDIFGDQGPTTIVKKKEQSGESSEQKTENMGTVVINSHIFSRIAEAVGIPPGACIWIIRNNKNLRYKVSTQFMDEMYRLNNFCESLPWVSLNHSEFVHNCDVEKEKGLEIFKKFNARKQHNNHGGSHHHKGGNSGRNYDNNKRKFQYKPGTQQAPAQKTHINKN